jgi:hypothetical protein
LNDRVVLSWRQQANEQSLIGCVVLSWGQWANEPPLIGRVVRARRGVRYTAWIRKYAVVFI